jgi:peptidoglycan/LPS O-acetylase OafA/YrhL
MSGKRHQLLALTGIRFFLALWVVVYHQAPPMESVLRSSPLLLRGFSNILHTGYSAVTVFFVLSGFVLAYNYDLRQFASPMNREIFAVARFTRIYPAYAVGLLLMLPLALYRLWAGIQIAPPLVEWGSFVLNLLLLQSWIPQTALTWNYPGWSLSNEALFYACFPVLGVLLWRINRPAVLWAAGAALWILSCTAPLIAVWAPAYHWGTLPATTLVLPADASIWANIVRYNPLLRLPEFCAGILLAKIYSHIPVPHWLRNCGPHLYVPAGTITMLLLIEADQIPYPFLHNGLLLPLFASIILGLALGGGFPAQWLSSPTFVLLGNASYSMYILHVPIYFWLGLFFRYALGRQPIGWIWFFSYVTVVILTACTFFKFVEDPLHHFLRGWLTRWLERFPGKHPAIIKT